MLALKVKGDVKAVTRDLNHLQRKVVPAATASALNKTATKVRTPAVRELAGKVGVKQKLIRERSRIKRASRRRLSAWLFVLLAGIPVIYLGARQTRSGVTAARKSYPAAFISTMPSGKTGVFKRRGRSRLPIAEQRVRLDPPGNDIYTRHMNTTGGREFKRLLEHELRWRLERKGLL